MREPIVLYRQSRQIDPRQYRKRSAQESDYTELIKDSCVIVDALTEKPVIVYLVLDDDATAVFEALERVECRIEARTGGLPTNSATIGYLPRNTIRKDWCTAASTAHRNPEEHALITSYAARVAQYYQQYHPELYSRHEQMVREVLPDWRIEDSIFTSGIINKNNPLPYHFDTGNFAGVWSNMLVFKKHIQGGYLSVPGYDVGFELVNNSLFMFDGQGILHGVTPIQLLSPESRRYSIVYYSLQQMWKCLTPKEEIRRIKELRTQREEDRLTRPTQPGLLKVRENMLQEKKQRKGVKASE